MKLFVETMDATLVDFDEDGRIRFEQEEWRRPSLQERRAVLFSAKQEMDQLTELMAILESEPLKKNTRP